MPFTVEKTRRYNSLVLKYLLINNSFENLEDRSRILNEYLFIEFQFYLFIYSFLKGKFLKAKILPLRKISNSLFSRFFVRE